MQVDDDEQEEAAGGQTRYPVMPSLVALQQMRNRLNLAYLGKKLMKWTALATGKELREVAREINRQMKDYELTMANAFLLLARSRYFYPNLNKMVLENVGDSACLRIDFTTRNSAGVKLAIFGIMDNDIDPNEHLGIEKGGTTIIEAKRVWRNLLKFIIYMLQLRKSFEDLNTANKNATKKKNAISRIVIPRLQATIQYILQALEEIEREDFYRLKKVTQGKRAKAKAEKKKGDEEPEPEEDTCPICALPTLKDIFSKLFPEQDEPKKDVCPICPGPTEDVCPICMQEVPPATDEICPECMQAMPPQKEICPVCMQEAPAEKDICPLCKQEAPSVDICPVCMQEAPAKKDVCPLCMQEAPKEICPICMQEAPKEICPICMQEAPKEVCPVCKQEAPKEICPVCKQEAPKEICPVCMQETPKDICCMPEDPVPKDACPLCKQEAPKELCPGCKQEIPKDASKVDQVASQKSGSICPISFQKTPNDSQKEVCKVCKSMTQTPSEKKDVCAECKPTKDEAPETNTSCSACSKSGFSLFSTPKSICPSSFQKTPNDSKSTVCTTCQSMKPSAPTSKDTCEECKKTEPDDICPTCKLKAAAKLAPKKPSTCPACKQSTPKQSKTDTCPACKQSTPKPSKTDTCPKCKQKTPSQSQTDVCPKCKQKTPTPSQTDSCPACKQKTPTQSQTEVCPKCKQKAPTPSKTDTCPACKQKTPTPSQTDTCPACKQKTPSQSQTDVCPKCKQKAPKEKFTCPACMDKKETCPICEKKAPPPPGAEPCPACELKTSICPSSKSKTQNATKDTCPVCKQSEPSDPSESAVCSICQPMSQPTPKQSDICSICQSMSQPTPKQSNVCSLCQPMSKSTLPENNVPCPVCTSKKSTTKQKGKDGETCPSCKSQGGKGGSGPICPSFQEKRLAKLREQQGQQREAKTKMLLDQITEVVEEGRKKQNKGYNKTEIEAFLSKAQCIINNLNKLSNQKDNVEDNNDNDTCCGTGAKQSKKATEQSKDVRPCCKGHTEPEDDSCCLYKSVAEIEREIKNSGFDKTGDKSACEICSRKSQSSCKTCSEEAEEEEESEDGSTDTCSCGDKSKGPKSSGSKVSFQSVCNHPGTNPSITRTSSVTSGSPSNDLEDDEECYETCTVTKITREMTPDGLVTKKETIVTSKKLVTNCCSEEEDEEEYEDDDSDTPVPSCCNHQTKTCRMVNLIPIFMPFGIYRSFSETRNPSVSIKYSDRLRRNSCSCIQTSTSYFSETYQNYINNDKDSPGISDVNVPSSFDNGNSSFTSLKNNSIIIRRTSNNENSQDYLSNNLTTSERNLIVGMNGAHFKAIMQSNSLNNTKELLTHIYKPTFSLGELFNKSNKL